MHACTWWMGTWLPSSPWTCYSLSTSGQTEAGMWFLPSTSKPMVYISHASPRDNAGLEWAAGFAPQLSILDGAVIIWLCHWISWTWVYYTSYNSMHVLALPRVSAARARLHQYPRCLHSVGLVAPPGLSHGLGTCLLMMLMLIKRHPGQKSILQVF